MDDMNNIKALDLFESFASKKIPQEKGCIFSASYAGNAGYAIYEITAYKTLRECSLAEEGLMLRTEKGYKFFTLIEPSDYSDRKQEPHMRDKRYMIPFLFRDLEIITAENNIKMMINKKLLRLPSAFFSARPEGKGFSMIFFPEPRFIHTIDLFLGKLMENETDIPVQNIARCKDKIVEKTEELLRALK